MSEVRAILGSSKTVGLGLIFAALLTLGLVTSEFFGPKQFSAEDLQQYKNLYNTSRNVEHPDTHSQKGGVLLLSPHPNPVSGKPGDLVVNSRQQKLPSHLAASSLEDVRTLIFVEDSGGENCLYWIASPDGKALGKGKVPSSSLQQKIETLPYNND